jgi:hypothetical protein
VEQRQEANHEEAMVVVVGRAGSQERARHAQDDDIDVTHFNLSRKGKLGKIPSRFLFLDDVLSHLLHRPCTGLSHRFGLEGRDTTLF